MSVVPAEVACVPERPSEYAYINRANQLAYLKSIRKNWGIFMGGSQTAVFDSPALHQDI
jgi:hypothetical protein